MILNGFFPLVEIFFELAVFDIAYHEDCQYIDQKCHQERVILKRWFRGNVMMIKNHCGG